MRDRIHIRLIVGIGLLVPASVAMAQPEQWLQYHSAREASQIVGDMSLQVLKLRTTKPKGLRAPEIKGQDQLFAKWSTPTVEKGRLWIALGRTQKRFV